MPERSLVAHTIHATGNAASYLFLVIVAISSFEVLMRYAMGQPTVWAHELSIAIAATCFVIGGPYVHASRQHITISFLYDQMPPAIQAWARLLCSVLTLAFVLSLSYASAVQGWQAVQYGETTGTALNWPIPAYLKALFAGCVAVMSLQTLMHVIDDLYRISRRYAPGSNRFDQNYPDQNKAKSKR